MDLLVAMRVYRRVVELHGFSAAARDLKISNAAVSKHVAWLEDRLESRLLERTTRTLKVTPTGAAYYEKCARILDDIDETEQSVMAATQAPRGLLRVNVPLAFSRPPLAEVLTSFAKRYPDIELDVALTDRFVDLVEDGVDVAVRIATSLADSSSLVAQKLARTRPAVCASPAFLRKHGTPRTVHDLVRFPCIEYSLVTRGAWPFGTDAELHVPVRSGLRVSNSELAKHAAVDGLGLVYLPLFYVERALASGALREILTDVPKRPITIHAVYPRSKHLTARVRAFVSHAKKKLEKAPFVLRERQTATG